MKTYIASSVWLSRTDKRFHGNNGSRQFTIVVRAKSQKRVAELVGVSLGDLRNFSGIHLASEIHASIPQRDEVIYFRAEHHGPEFGKWFAYE